MKDKIYVGCKQGKWMVFKFQGTPTEQTHGDQFFACVGPFRTMRAARFMAEHGQGNPHLGTVSDCEIVATSMKAGK